LVALATTTFAALLATGSVVQAASGGNASISDYSQCANGAPPNTATSCTKGWINGILNAQNSGYHENENTAQRALLALPTGGSLTGRTITISYLTRKGVHHAYDSLGQWDLTQSTALRCQQINPAAACPGGSPSNVLIPSDTTVVADTGSGSATNLHELPAAQRYMTMYGGTITNISTPVHTNAAGPGDDYASVQVTYSVTSVPTNVELLFGGHLALGPGSAGWGTGLAASDINGGPYHIRVIEVDGAAIGNRDNQIMSNAILPITTSVVTQLSRTNGSGIVQTTPTPGLAITVLTGSYVQDKATVTPATATGLVDFKYYGSSSDCTGDTSGTSAGSGKTLNASGEAFSDEVQFNSIGTFYWRAFFNATGTSVSSSSACNEVLTVQQATSSSTILHERTSSAGTTDVDPANNGQNITVSPGAYVNDVVTVTPSSATGTVAFKTYTSLADCGSNTSGTARGTGISLSSGSATSDTVQFSTVGTVYWRAFFTGTGGNLDSSSPCTLGDNESVTVQKASPTLASAPRLIPQDSATLAGIISGGSTQATLTFGLYAPSDTDCTGTPVFSQVVDVNANGTFTTTNSGDPASTPAGFRLTSSSDTGTYRWKVVYSGDEANNGNTKACGDESFVFNGITDASAS
jgi:hypothetical protein